MPTDFCVYAKVNHSLVRQQGIPIKRKKRGGVKSVVCCIADMKMPGDCNIRRQMPLYCAAKCNVYTVSVAIS